MYCIDTIISALQGPLSNTIQQTLGHLRHEASHTDLDLSILKGTEDNNIPEMFGEANNLNPNQINTSSEEFERHLSEAVKVPEKNIN